jgi:hypothetical protein
LFSTVFKIPSNKDLLKYLVNKNLCNAPYDKLPASVADPDPGSDAFLTPGSWIQDQRWVKKSKSGSGMNIPDHVSESLETNFWVKNT